MLYVAPCAACSQKEDVSEAVEMKLKPSPCRCPCIVDGYTGGNCDMIIERTCANQVLHYSVYP
jgi:hypothetical protein